MDATHLHLMLNHVPVLGIPIGLALLIAGLLLRSSPLRIASLVMFVAFAAIAVVVFLTGEPAEERLEAIAEVGDAVIEPHEDAASIAIWGAVALGAVAAVALLLHVPRFNSRIGKRLLGASLIAPMLLALAVSLMLFRTASLGGQIRHTEIRSDRSSLPAEIHADIDD
jgi:hypothetical protein